MIEISLVVIILILLWPMIRFSPLWSVFSDISRVINLLVMFALAIGAFYFVALEINSGRDFTVSSAEPHWAATGIYIIAVYAFLVWLVYLGAKNYIRKQESKKQEKTLLSLGQKVEMLNMRKRKDEEQ